MCWEQDLVSPERNQEGRHGSGPCRPPKRFKPEGFPGRPERRLAGRAARGWGSLQEGSKQAGKPVSHAPRLEVTWGRGQGPGATSDLPASPWQLWKASNVQGKVLRPQWVSCGAGDISTLLVMHGGPEGRGSNGAKINSAHQTEQPAGVMDTNGVATPNSRFPNLLAPPEKQPGPTMPPPPAMPGAGVEAVPAAATLRSFSV